MPKLFLGSKYCATWAFAQLEYVPVPLPGAPLNVQIEFHVHAAAGCTPVAASMKYTLLIGDDSIPPERTMKKSKRHPAASNSKANRLRIDPAGHC